MNMWVKCQCKNVHNWLFGSVKSRHTVYTSKFKLSVLKFRQDNKQKEDLKVWLKNELNQIIKIYL